MRVYIEPANILIYEEQASSGKKAKGWFGGFCECGGTLIQRTWHNINGRDILISECDRCWRFKLIAFVEYEVYEISDVVSFNRNNLREFFKSFLSEAEYEAVMTKIEGKNYNYSAFSRAKKRFEEMGLDIDSFLKLI